MRLITNPVTSLQGQNLRFSLELPWSIIKPKIKGVHCKAGWSAKPLREEAWGWVRCLVHQWNCFYFLSFLQLMTNLRDDKTVSIIERGRNHLTFGLKCEILNQTVWRWGCKTSLSMEILTLPFLGKILLQLAGAIAAFPFSLLLIQHLGLRQWESTQMWMRARWETKTLWRRLGQEVGLRREEWVKGQWGQPKCCCLGASGRNRMITKSCSRR